jgi:hypothetical protein
LAEQIGPQFINPIFRADIMTISIPQCLMAYARDRAWVSWNLVRRNGEATKVPFAPATGFAAKTNDQTTWGTLEQAQRLAKVRAYPGVGIVSAAVPEAVFIDLDDCVEVGTGRVSPAAKTLLDACGCSYAEMTPSKTGLRVIGTAPSLGEIGCKGTLDGLKLEIYKATARFLTVTGQKGTRHPDVLADITNVVVELLGRLGAPREPDSDAISLTSDLRETCKLIQLVATGEELHNPICALAARLVSKRVPAGDVAEILRGVMMALHPEDDRDERWLDRYYDIDRIVESAVRKFGSDAESRTELARLAGRLIRQKASPADVRTRMAAEAHRLGFDPERALAIARAIADREIANAA